MYTCLALQKQGDKKKPWHTLMFLSQNAGKEAAQPSKPKTQSKKAPPKKEVPKPSESEEEDDDDDDEDEEEEEEDADDVDDDGKLVILSDPSSLQSKTIACSLPLSFILNSGLGKKIELSKKQIICRKSKFIILSEFVTHDSHEDHKPSVIVSSLSVYRVWWLVSARHHPAGDIKVHWGASGNRFCNLARESNKAWCNIYQLGFFSGCFRRP